MSFRRDRVRMLREKAGFTQEMLAERAGLTLRTVQRYEDESGSEPRISDAARLAEALNTTVDFLAGNTDESALSLTEADLSNEERLLISLLRRRQWITIIQLASNTRQPTLTFVGVKRLTRLRNRVILYSWLGNEFRSE